jgi:hypothetical protein
MAILVLTGCGGPEATASGRSGVDDVLCQIMPTARRIPSDLHDALDAARTGNGAAMTRSANAASTGGHKIAEQLTIATSALPRSDARWAAGVHLISIGNFGVQGGVFFGSGEMPSGPSLRQFAVGLPLLDQEETSLAEAMKAIGLGDC